MTISTRDRWLGGAALLLLGGLLMAVAAVVRWLPCLGEARDALCVRRQSRTFDYIAPFTPHESLPAAAVLAGLGMLLIAASGLMLTGRRRIKPWLSRLTLVVMMSKPLVLGLLTLLGPVTGGMPRNPTVWLGAEIVIDLAVAAVLLITPNDLLDDYRRLLLYAVPIWLVGWIGGVVDRLFWGLLNESADVPPGSGLIPPLIIIGCAIGIAAVTRDSEKARLPAQGSGSTLEGPAHR